MTAQISNLGEKPVIGNDFDSKIFLMTLKFWTKIMIKESQVWFSEHLFPVQTALLFCFPA